MKKILITGGCGFIGANLIHYLSQNTSYKIRVLDNESLGKLAYIDAEVEFIRADTRNRSAVKDSLKDIDTVVHLAADTRVIDSISDPLFNFENNVQATINILEAMREMGTSRLVNASTGGAIIGEVQPPVNESMTANPTSPYGASKLAVEGYCSAYAASYGINATSLRFSNVYGPRSYHKGSVVAQFMKAILRGEQITVYGDGSQTRDYVFVNDLCQGITKAIESEISGVFQLGTGIPTSINELLSTISNIIDRRLDIQYKPFRAGEIRHTYCDITKAENELVYAPTTSLSDGLNLTWQWFMSKI